MLTDLSNTRNSNLYLTIALTVIILVFLSFAAVPAISLGKQVSVAAPGTSETGSDYYQRHPELNVPVAIAPDLTSDFALRHPQWVSAAAPVIGGAEASDYFQRHPELRTANPTIDLSDYFQRH